MQLCRVGSAFLPTTRITALFRVGTKSVPTLLGYPNLRELLNARVTIMRLTPAQTQITKNTVDRVLGTSSKVWLFGSRIDDNARGGDIDLMIETEAALLSRADAICRLYGALVMALGDRKLDIVLKDARTFDAPIFEIVRRTGILL